MYLMLVSAATLVKRLWFAQPDTERAIFASFALRIRVLQAPRECLQMPKRYRLLLLGRPHLLGREMVRDARQGGFPQPTA